ncbi:MAG: helix-turn-helix domain-containing protein [Acidobacteria bacterium]|nr:helix-turn-helix domain-containing protein [Acidobacteriota bacterium]
MNRLLRVEEVAERLGIKVSTVRAWLFYGKLRKVKLGRAVRVPEDFLEEFIKGNTRYERPSDD